MPEQDPSLGVTDVNRSFGERFMSGLGGVIKGMSGIQGKSPLDEAIEKHHQRRLDEARMHRQNAATYAGVLATGFDPKTGEKLTPEQEQQYQNWYETSWAAYEKAAGVSKETKGHLQRAKQITEHVIGIGRKHREQQEGQQAPAPGQAPPPMDAPDAAGGGGLAPPPKVADAAAPQASPSPKAQGGLTPPPKVSSAQDHMAEMQAPAVRQQAQDINDPRTITGSHRQFAQSVSQRKELAEQLGLDKDSRAYKEFVATGKFPATAHLQHSAFIDPADKDKKVQMGSYDPGTGEYLDQEGKVVEGAQQAPSAASQAPKQIHYLSPDGKPLFGFQVGMKLYDQEGKELPSGTEFFTRGMLPTQTLRQVITYDAQGNPQVNTLETLHTPITGGKAAPGAPGGSAAGPKRGAAPAGGGLTPPPKAKEGGARDAPPPVSKDALGKPLGMSAAAQKNQAQRATAVREAYTQIFGDPDNPGLRPLKDYASLADNKESRERLGKALEMTFDGLEQQEKAHGSMMALIQAYGGVPQALAAAKANVQSDVIQDLTPEEQEAYNATVSSFSSIVGLRSLTSASAAQFSVKALERDLPMIGVNVTNSRGYNDKLSHVGEIAYNGLKTIGNIIPPKEKDYFQKQIDSLRTAPKSSKGGLTPPPKPGGAKETPDEEFQRLTKGLTGKSQGPH